MRATLAGVVWAHSGVVAYSYRKSGAGLSSSTKQWVHAQRLLGVAACSCRASGFNRFLVAGFIDLLVRKGMRRLTVRRSPEGFN